MIAKQIARRASTALPSSFQFSSHSTTTAAAVRHYYPSTPAQMKQVQYMWPALGLVPVIGIYLAGAEDFKRDLRNFRRTALGGVGHHEQTRSERVRAGSKKSDE